MNIRALLIALALAGQPASAFAQSTAQPVTPGYLTTTGCPSGYTSCFKPYGPAIPVTPSGSSLTYLGKQIFTAATLATSTTLTPPAGATIADFYPECVTAGADNQCVRFDPATTASATTSAGIASQQLILGYTGPLSTMQVILATGATGASGNTLVVYYYK